MADDLGRKIADAIDAKRQADIQQGMQHEHAQNEEVRRAAVFQDKFATALETAVASANVGLSGANAKLKKGGGNQLAPQSIEYQLETEAGRECLTFSLLPGGKIVAHSSAGGFYGKNYSNLSTVDFHMSDNDASRIEEIIMSFVKVALKLF